MDGIVDNLHIGQAELIAGHARFSAEAGGDDYHLGVGGFLVAISSADAGIKVDDGCRLGDIQRLALRQTGDNVHQDDIGISPLGNSLGAGGTDIAGANDADFSRYFLAPQFFNYCLGDL